MNLKMLKQLIAQGESEWIEFKKSTAQLKPAFETICAFLNKEGGAVIIGVAQDGKIVGQEVTDNTQLEIANLIRKIEPAADIKMSIISLDKNHDRLGKSIILLEALSKNHHKPYLFNGKSYERIGSATVPMKLDQFQNLLTEKILRENPWDEQIAKSVRYKDLDQKEILQTLKDAISCGRISDKFMHNAKTALLKFGLLVKKNRQFDITNAAVVLFGKELTINYLHCCIKLARFRGTDKRTFIDSKRFTGNIFQLLEEGMNFVHRNMSIASKFVEDDWRRQDIPQFPPLAVREAILNALAHRDYVQPYGYVEVGMYDDRIEIASLGDLPQGVSLKLLKKYHQSVPRNQLIANVLYRRGYIEQWGKGTNLIVSECKSFNFPEPTFLVRQGFFCVTIFAAPQDQVDVNIQKLDLTDLNLTERQKEILSILQKQKAASLKQIMEMLEEQLSRRVLQKELVNLRTLGLIKNVGRTKGSQWKIQKLK